MQTADRNFDAKSVAGLSAEARKAVNAAFDAMSTWRTETMNNSEKNVAQVIDKMAAAARALGWPEQIVDTTRVQMQNLTKVQLQTIDHMMDTWEEQIKSPNPSAMLSKLQSIPGLSPTGPDGRNIQPIPGLRTIRRTVAKSVGKREWCLGQSW